MTLEYAETIKGLLQALTGDRPEKNFEALRSLFAELNYEYQKVELPLSGDAEKCLAGHPLVIAEAGGYRIVYARLADERLKKTSEREVLKELAKKLPYALFIFSNKSQNSWHFINIKDINADEKKITDRTKKLQILRRITIAPEERLRTASQRIAMLNAQNAPGDMLGVSPLAVKALHDAAFNVEAVTKAFFEEYKGVFNELWGYLEKQTDDRKWAHDYALLFLNRLMFLYFIQRKKWLGNDPEFLATFYKAYKQSGQPKNTFFEKWLSVMFFKAFNHKYQGGHTQFPKEINEASSC